MKKFWCVVAVGGGSNSASMQTGKRHDNRADAETEAKKLVARFAKGGGYEDISVIIMEAVAGAAVPVPDVTITEITADAPKAA